MKICTDSIFQNRKHFGCVIMASGLGLRFGGNKLMADFKGTPMICRVLSATEKLFSDRIVVTRHEEVAELCREQKIRVLLHHLPYRSDTVRLGLEALDPELCGCLFCPGDQPLLKRETVRALLWAAETDESWKNGNGSAAIWRPEWNQIPGSPVLFPRVLFSELKTLPQGKGGGYLLKKYPDRVHTISVQEEEELKDVDTWDDLKKLEQSASR